MRTPYFLLLVILILPSISFAWIPETVDVYRDMHIEPSLRPEEELRTLEGKRGTATSTDQEPKDQEPFEFRQEHMKKILE